MLARQTPFTEELRIRGEVIARFQQDTSLHITAEHEKTRSEILNAIKGSSEFSCTVHQVVASGNCTRDDCKEQIRIEQAILKSLGFPHMYDRYHGIEDAHKRTFDWIYRPIETEISHWDDFSSWLAQGQGIYWINGKAGSGKSTLMRYISDDSRTSSLLDEWAGGSDGLLSASFFFWKSGVPEQASQSGLLRSLLHSLLSQRRDLMPKVVPEAWKTLHAAGNQWKWTQPWHQKVLERSVRTCFELLSGSRVCLFIDGLDEYDGDPAHTIELLKRIASIDVKICVSSRPWNEFHEAFDAFPGLRLQDLTFHDIRLYVNETLVEDKRMIALREEEQNDMPKMVTDIVTKADGVFLWVKLVVRSLLEGITNGDTISQLQARIEELPSELHGLYTYMLAVIKPRYRSEGSKYFQMMHALRFLDMLPMFPVARQSIRALVFSSVSEDTVCLPKASQNYPLAPQAKISMVTRIEKRIRVCCAGLLELAREPATDIMESRGIRNENPLVVYIHRTASDYLAEHHKDILEASSDIKFGVYTALLAGFLFQLRNSEMGVSEEAYQFAKLIGTVMSLAYEAEKEDIPPSIELLEATLRMLSRYLRPLPKFGQSRIAKIEISPWPHDTVVWAIRCSLFRYASLRLGLPCRIPRSLCEMSYLCHVLGAQQEGVFDPGEVQCYTWAITSERIVAFLLPHASQADIAGAWELALWGARHHVVRLRADLKNIPRWKKDEVSEMWLSILKLFLEHGADPRKKIALDWAMKGRDGPSERAKSCTAEEIIGFLAEDHPREVAEIQSLIGRSQRWWPRIGTSKPTSSRAWQDYPERTWWRKSKRS